MFKDNLIQLRKMKKMTQEGIAEKVGVTRQAVAKWEAGETVPDLEKCRLLAELFGVSLDDLANYEPEENMGLSLPPKGKHLFGGRARSSFRQKPEKCLIFLQATGL